MLATDAGWINIESVVYGVTLLLRSNLVTLVVASGILEYTLQSYVSCCLKSTEF